ncbi:MAG: metal-dependent transcriptional regulator [Clostridia bacterium]|nr:metal-dependent transcriptional regulator [Clostridia bacterium]
MRLQESGEMYLETILILSQRQRFVRSIDVADYMGFSKPSVSRAVSLLKQGEYITVDREGFLYLTEAGREVAEKIYERHTVLTEILTGLGVSPEVAEQDACRIEHDISDETFAKMKEHLLRNA